MNNLTTLRLGLAKYWVLLSILLPGVSELPLGSKATTAHASDEVSFNRDIRPILSEYCFTCHGPDGVARQSGLRLDLADAAIAELDSGAFAIIPNDPHNSELVKRIRSREPSERMPPVESLKLLSQEQIELLEKWIADGAEYEPHWSFVPVERPDLPVVDKIEGAQDWLQNDIDRFVLEKLNDHGMTSSPPATKETLIRRVAFDLTGLPPTIEEIDRFVNEESIDAYQRVVDHYLDSPEYAEHMARFWLDQARYADSNGYQYDTERQQWVWRDWVIDAFQRNVPFDQFTIEQLAGDLLPDATPQQRLATGFNRNHSITIEGGVIDEEYRTEYVMDRIATTGTVWLGLTLNCARCHDHKYDPISRREFYQLYAFFNQVPEKGLNGFDPRERIPSPFSDSRLASIEQRIHQLKSQQTAIATDDENSPNNLTDVEIEELKSLEKERAEFYPATLIMRELEKPRPTYMLERGEYDQLGEVVSAAFPAVFSTTFSHNQSPDRLSFARWLVDPGNPLTARVTVNRFWQRFFGVGLVKTSEDFGLQGELPSHPELLDWLAAEFMESGWDMKHIQRLIVLSATYRQSSHVGLAAYQADPQNRMLGRGPRMRLDAEEIRDAALAVSGLLVKKLGGRSVYPYQPEGLWTELNNRPGFSQEYVLGEGADLYRRSLYSFWKRSVPLPMLKTFDAPDREVCIVQRSRTNTPLQALVLMNAPQFVEAARHLAQRIITQVVVDANDPDSLGLTADEIRIDFGFQQVVGRLPQPQERSLLVKALNEERLRLVDDPVAVDNLLNVGNSPRDQTIDPNEHAAWTVLSRLLLNLDEFVTKE